MRLLIDSSILADSDINLTLSINVVNFSAQLVARKTLTAVSVSMSSVCITESINAGNG